MRYEEVPRKAWIEEVASFSRQHHGWRVTVRRADTAALDYDLGAALSGAEVLAVEQPLQVVELRRKETQVEVMVEVGEEVSQRFWLKELCRLWREQVDGTEEGMRFDDAKGHSLLVEFRAPVPPEALDGLAETEQ